jgi:hypothetical protein
MANNRFVIDLSACQYEGRLMNIMTLSDLMYRLITGHALAASHIV